MAIHVRDANKGRTGASTVTDLVIALTEKPRREALA
jgi:hypothetical protein